MNATYTAGVESTGINSTDGIASAVATASSADVAIVFVGLSPCNGWVHGDPCNGAPGSLVTGG